MKRSHYFNFIIGLLVLQACNQQPKQQASVAQSYPVISIPTKTVIAYSSYPASVEGTNNSGVRAKVAGYITQVLVDEGQKVRQGQVLFTLETQSLSQDAEAAKANVNAAQVEVDKLVPLVEKNIISNVQLETAKAQLAQAQSGYNSIAASIGYATIKSPIDGHVGSIPYREGALVSPSDPQPLTMVSTTEDVYVFFAMNEKDYLNFLKTTKGNTRDEKVKNFPEVELELATGTIYDQKGKIETVTGQINQSTGTVTFRAKFSNPNGLLANGSSGTIRIPKTYENTIVVPESATYEQQGIVYVYKVQGDTLAVSTPIEILDRADGLVVLNSGLKQGDHIVGNGVVKLRNNTSIVPQMVEFDSIANGLKTVFK
ncbi:MAG: efflux RND transporter periplasmic adaptor subunit [Sediminicola sp.]